MYYIIYKLTNLINNKIYIGSHKTKNVNDNYMGSGKYLKYAQEKYGVENFKKEILYIFDNAIDMYAKEAEMVNKDFLINENTYNLRIGGAGGWDYVNNSGLRDTTACFKGGAAISKLGGGFAGKKHTEESRKLMLGFNRSGFKGKTHSSESKDKIGAANKLNSLGNKNASKKLSISDKNGNVFTSIKECADFYKVSTTAIYKKIKRGTF
jgi:group I intron endonuclease